MDKKTHIVFVFHFAQLYLFPYKCPSPCCDLDQGIHNCEKVKLLIKCNVFEAFYWKILYEECNVYFLSNTLGGICLEI